MSQDTGGWVRIGATRATIEPLLAVVVAEGLTDITPRGLMDLIRESEVPHVKIGHQRYTKRQWVAGWLESLRVPAD